MGWSLAEVATGVVQGYEALAMYRDVFVPESRARELVTSAVAVPAWAPRNNGSRSASPPRAADEQLRESLSRGEDGGTSIDVAGSPVRSRQRGPSFSSVPMANDVEIQLEVDREFDELVAVKAREELEDLYGFPPVVSLDCFLGIKDRLLTVPPGNYSTYLSSCRACCASRLYCCPSALSFCCRRGTLPRPSPRLQ